MTGRATGRGGDALGWRDPVRWVLGAMVVGWSVVFIVLGWIRQARFATFSFDLGIYDQAVWLLSRFHDPFVTVRGLEFFGHHVNPIMLLFVPFYWLGAGPLFLLSAQVVVQASGAVAIFLLARDRIHDRWLAVALGRGPPAQPHVPVAHVGVLPSRRAGDRAAAVRVLGCTDRPLEVVRALRGAGRRVQGGRRARDRGDGRADRGARQPQDRADHAGRRASPGTRSRPG